MTVRDDTPTTLADLSSRFLESLAADTRSEYQAGVSRFVQWFGADRKAAELRPLDVERFAEAAQAGAASGRWLEPVHAFLTYAHKEGATGGNFSANLRLRKPTSRDRSHAAALNVGQVLMTAEGYEALEHELQNLKDERPIIAQSLRSAMADKDFRENSPLDAAREQQAHVEARIRELEQTLKVASVVESIPGPATITHVGCHVEVRDLDTGEVRRFTLVSPTEVNPREGKISIASPVGRALLDRFIGDQVEIVVPRGSLRLKIESIEG